MRRVVAAVAGSVVALGVGGYAVADIADRAPGVLTDEPVPTATLFPVAPGATPPAPIPKVADPAARAGAIDGAQLAATLDPLLAPEAGLGPAISVHITQPGAAEPVFERAGERLTQPASLVKILTVYAALDAFGPSWTTSTSTYLDAGTVVLASSGDMLLGTGDEYVPGSAKGRASLAQLARDTAVGVRAQGVTAVRVALEDAAFPGPATPPGWEPGDIAAGYVAPVHSAEINAGRVADERFAKRHADPGLHAAGVFADLLAAEGITVEGAPERTATSVPFDVLEPLATVTSAPLREVAAYTLRSSDNTVAEALARHVAMHRGAETTFDASARAVLDQLAEAGIDIGQTQLADGSGLSDGSLAPASVFTQVLSRAAADNNPRVRAVVTGLPVAGVEGTLAERFTNQPLAKGVTRAKTGTLSGVSALAGVTRDERDRVLVFAVLADDTPSTMAARETSDAIVEALRACSC